MGQARPTIVLTVIVAIICGLLIVTYNATYKDTSGIVTEKLQAACDAVYGVGGEYSIVTDWRDTATEKLSSATDDKSQELLANIDRIVKIVKTADGNTAYELKVKGYKDGLDVLVGFDASGTVAGVSVVSAAEETPGLGSKVTNSEWLSAFKGLTTDVEIVKSAPAADNQVQAITSATYSSKGVAKAVNLARLANELLGGAVNE